MIKLLPDLFGTKINFIWFKINRKSAIAIQIWFNTLTSQYSELIFQCIHSEKSTEYDRGDSIPFDFQPNRIPH